jgi:uncharacterized protein
MLLGMMHFTGAGVPEDPAKAAMWFKRAADRGHPLAMVKIGLAHVQGKGVEMDFAKAAMWFKRAADLGQSAGMVDLGMLLAQGKGIERNDAAAVTWYRKAAAAGEAVGMFNLAWMLENGRGVARKDPEQAADLVMQALARHSEEARRHITQNHAIWSKEFRQALQRKLRDAGFNPGLVNGYFRESTIAAVNAYFNRHQ